MIKFCIHARQFLPDCCGSNKIFILLIYTFLDPIVVLFFFSYR